MRERQKFNSGTREFAAAGAVATVDSKCMPVWLSLRKSLPRFFSLVSLASALLAVDAAGHAAHAGLLSRILHEAGEAGAEGAARAGRWAERDLGAVADHLKTIPDIADVVSLATDLDSEGHWRLVNRNGEVFNANSADELQRVLKSLSPGNGKLRLYLTPKTIFGQKTSLKDLPADVELFLSSGPDNHALVRETRDGQEKLFAVLRPNLWAGLETAELYTETVQQIDQALKPNQLRVIALETGRSGGLAVKPALDPATGAALVDRVDPKVLAEGLASVPGQTLILSGRVEGEALKFIDAGGAEAALSLDSVRRAAAASGVDLVIVKTDPPRQPSGHNRFWQSSSGTASDAAGKPATFGDLLAGIGSSHSAGTLYSRWADGRALIDWVPSAAPAEADVKGEMDFGAVAGIEADLRDHDRRSELDLRIVPGIPSAMQMGYLAFLIMGIFGLGTAWNWWGRLWPAGGYRGRVSGAAISLVRLILFALVFLPLLGLPMFVRYIALQVWEFMTLPVRILGWLRGRLMPRAR